MDEIIEENWDFNDIFVDHNYCDRIQYLIVLFIFNWVNMSKKLATCYLNFFFFVLYTLTFINY